MTDVITRLANDNLLGAGYGVGNGGVALNPAMPTIFRIVAESRQPIIVAAPPPPPSVFPSVAAVANPTIQRLAGLGYLGTDLPIGNRGITLDYNLITINRILSGKREPNLIIPVLGQALPGPVQPLTVPLTMVTLAPTSVSAPVKTIALPTAIPTQYPGGQESAGLLNLPRLPVAEALVRPVAAPAPAPEISEAVPLQTSQVQLSEAIDRLVVDKLKTKRGGGSYTITDLKGFITSFGLPKPKSNAPKPQLIEIIVNYLSKVAPEKLRDFKL